MTGDGADVILGAEDDGAVRLLLIVGPHADPDTLGAVEANSRTVLPQLRAVVDHVATGDEAETVDALRGRYDAIVLDPGVLEHYSRRTADAVSRCPVPVIVATQAGERRMAAIVGPRVVTPAAVASVQGGGAAAYDGAVEAAARLAWQRRGPAPSGAPR